MQQRSELKWPADLYLEGADQYRGWFQSSLLTSVAWKGKAPYKAVCTHGWVVDGMGRQMHKSLGNGIAPEDIIKKFGADILRLWVASSDYHADIRISPEILKQLSDAYRKIRNTAKYILGNLYDFNPDTDMVADQDLMELDRLALDKLSGLIRKVNEAYEAMDFHIVYHAIHNFCVVDMSNFYLDITKDRLYCEKADGVKRRAAQTTLYRILDALTRMLAPILAFTAEEIWSYMPHKSTDDAESVLFNEMYQELSVETDDAFHAKWDLAYAVRDDVQKALEQKPAKNQIGKSLEAKVTLHCEGALYNSLKDMKDQLAEIFICSQVEVVTGDAGEVKAATQGLSITVSKAEGEKCDRCWIYSETVGQHHEHDKLCARCASVLEA